MDYLLDTNTVSSMMEPVQAVVGRFDKIGPLDNVYSSVVTEGELLFGVLRAPEARRDFLRDRINDILSAISGIVPVTRDVARTYGDIRHRLVTSGQSLADNDLWIAATALANDYVLVSHDSGFRRISGLRLEDWLA